MAKRNAGFGGKETRHMFKNRRLIITCFLFILLVLGLSFIAHVPNFLSFIFYGLANFTANVAGAVINLAGIKAEVVGYCISLKNQVLFISIECTAIYLMIVYGSFLLAYPAGLKNKTVGMLFGIPVIFAANILRLLVTAFVAEFRPSYLRQFHNYIWQTVFIIFVILLWMVWIEKVVGHESKTAVSG